MQKSILVAGATGNLGERIITSLLEKGADVHAIVRTSATADKIAKLENLGVKVFKVDLSNQQEVEKACSGVTCVVSALQGLHDVIVDTQKVLLDAAIAAGVKRLIPSDFSLDFTKINSVNRNFDLRRKFLNFLDNTGISSTSIYNGAFAEILSYGIPILDFRKKTVGYWGDDPDYKLDFTTMDNTAAFTAAAALDDTAPKSLRIASFQISPNELVKLAGKLTGSAFTLIHMGTLEQFDAYNKQQRASNPEGENELNPRWQSGQYMHDMFSVQHESLDNNRYSNISWTGAEEFLKPILKS